MTRLTGPVLLMLCLGAGVQSPVSDYDVVAVGVRYDPDPDPVRRRTDLENMRRLRFNVVAVPTTDAVPPFEVVLIERLLARDPNASLRVASSAFSVVAVPPQTTAGSVREGAWTRLAAGTRGVIFDDWAGLQQNAAAFDEAAAFAETITRNMALYAPLRRVEATGPRAITITGGRDSVEAHWLESPDAMLLIAVNHAAEPRSITLSFPADIPEAVWQNMLSGASVNFVAGPTGPSYEHTFPAHDVLVLMIRKRWK
jgi:hypothetical protein